MRIDELDEFQGLTPHMVRQHLEKTGWHLKSWDHYREWHLEHCEGPPCVAIYDGSKDGMYQFDLESALRALLVVAKRSPQSLLREINPRMRKGMPSRSALEAHGESRDWLSMGYVLHAVRFCWTVNDHVQMVAGTDVFSTERAEDVEMIQRCSFWPCDAQGNKVRWPTDAQGNML